MNEIIRECLLQGGLVELTTLVQVLSLRLEELGLHRGKGFVTLSRTRGNVRMAVWDGISKWSQVVEAEGRVEDRLLIKSIKAKMSHGLGNAVYRQKSQETEYRARHRPVPQVRKFHLQAGGESHDVTVQNAQTVLARVCGLLPDVASGRPGDPHS